MIVNIYGKKKVHFLNCKNILRIKKSDKKFYLNSCIRIVHDKQAIS